MLFFPLHQLPDSNYIHHTDKEIHRSTGKSNKKIFVKCWEYKLRTNRKEIEGYKSAAEQTGMNLNKYII